MLPVASARITESSLSKADVRETVAKMVPEQLAFIKRRAALVRNLLNAIEDRLKAFSDEDLRGIGFRRTDPKGQRYIGDLVGMYHALNKEGLMTNTELFGICEVSLDSLYDLLVPKLQAQGVKTKKGAIEQIDGKLSPFMKRNPTSGRLVDIK
jgi:hypothetical protein